MPSGDMKPVKVPVSKNMLDSHIREELSRKGGRMVTVAIKDAQFPGVAGLASHQYTVAIRLTQDQSACGESFLHQQSARTSGSISNYSCSELEVVNWSEVFFFKVDSPEFYMLELIVTNMGRGDPVGFFSAPLNQIAESSDQYDYVDGLTWMDLSPAESMRMTQEDKSKKCGKIRFSVLLSPQPEIEENNKSFFLGARKSGLIQISPTMEGPWTTVKLNYATPAACWRLGNDVIASEVSVKDGNRYMTIRSLVAICNNTDFLLDLCLIPKADTTTQDIYVGLLKPGDSVSLPLSGLTQHGLYVLKLRPAGLDGPEEYSWSSVVANSREQKSCDEICVSTLARSEDLLCCTQMNGSSSRVPHLLWFCVSTQAVEIAKDIHSEPIQDWTILLKSPLSITNNLPLESEYSVLERQATGHFLVCNRGIFGPGKTVNVYNADIRNQLFFSLLPQRGWLPIHEAVIISHPQGIQSKTIEFRSSATGRIVQVILEQNYDKDRPLLAKIIRIYAPYWFAIARCPPLTLKLLDLTVTKQTRKIGFPFQYKKNKEILLEEITEEEIYEGHTIASALNFKFLGLSVSIAHSGDGQYGPVKDLSPLGDMDGSLDLYAYAADGKCMRLFISTKPCPYQSVPTKVISVRPFFTFTNRLGEDIYIKLSSDDEPKKLHTVDSRVSFLYHESGGREELQVCLEDTEWSFPVQIVKEDTITLVLRRHNGTRRFLRTEIRGFEEGSRFIVVFRLGSTNGPIRIENRTTDKTIGIRQSGFGDKSWIQLESLSTTNFSWEDPYGQKVIDAKIDSGFSSRICKIDMESIGLSSEVQRELGMQFHVVETGDIKVLKFTNDCIPASSGEGNSSVVASGNLGNSQLQSVTESDITTLELIVELGVVGISVIDHRPKELSYLYLEKVFVSYSTGYDCGTTSRFKLILGGLQIDNMLPLSLMPVLLAPEQMGDVHHPVFKMTITMHNEDTDGIKVFPYVYLRVTEKPWRLNIHEPIIWAFVDLYNNLQLDRIPKSSNVGQVDPEIRIDLVDVSEVRLKVSLETAPAERPHGILGVWSPILSAVGNALKIQVHLRRVMHRDRFMRQSSIIPAISNRIWRDLIHNPLHLIFSLDVLGMTSSTLASLSKGFAELSTDGQFLQLRSKQVWSRRITGVSDGIIQGTEALAQGVAFGVSGVVTKPVESARQNGLLGLAHGLGRAFLGFIVQPVSGALDFFSLTVDGIGASCSKCLEVLNNRTALERIRNPRAIHGDGVLREYCEKEAVGQMILYLAEASRHFGCTEIFKEPAKFAWSDLYEEHFVVPYQRIVLVTNKRVMLLQCPHLDKMDKKPSKIMWDVPWEELMALELAKAGCLMPSHLMLHLKNFRRSENFVRIIKCSVEEIEGREHQAVRICSVVRKMWKAYQSDIKCLTLKVPSSQRFVYFSWNVTDGNETHTSSKAIINSRDLSSSSSMSNERKFVKHTINFSKIWSSERESRGRCTLCRKQLHLRWRYSSCWQPSSECCCYLS
ncbi:uncharacterized protein LOC110810873 isoform X2 [Carica papaya]|uniref:uncharacterized protein LOC110810873 isoform X2 n=1 Tax=Carica papaya TaxID=3649 RepID=UPI000B8C90F3|nr:uncharacterized protein LOC110810873 isoform X2 [Carica papaya]